jgi:glycogen operon protein
MKAPIFRGFRPEERRRPSVWRGDPYPLGATFDGHGTNFALFSEVASRVELCLFDDEHHETRVDLPERTALVWHGYIPNVRPGQRYGYRVHGPFDPAQGLRCNPSKLLVDPYAKAVEGGVRWSEAVFGYRFGGEQDMDPNGIDSAGSVPLSVVTDPFFHWGNDRHPSRPWEETVIYELHVRGFTQAHPAVPEDLRGTFGGLAQPDVVDYLSALGVTAVELLPVHQFIHDQTLIDRGLRNYWGYNSIAYLAPHNEYSSSGHRGQQVQEFKQMVKILHEAGIEVILDVVYNHTAEGNHLGPTLSFKGIDNLAYYRVASDDPHRYVDYTGTGNSMNMRHPNVLQLIMDSLRYWVTEMHVDGFRFDLAATLARELHDVDRLSAFFDLIQQDPVMRRTKLIAEPWDVGEGGYQVGNFPPLWSEWNGRYRDSVRDLWRGQPSRLPDFAYRFTGSSDLYQAGGRRPYNSINFVTCHDGFTLADLVSYNEKRNQANGEDNRDGMDDNRSWNCGVEGPSADRSVLDLRARQQRNFLATLLLSQGVPMILAGDEIGRTQQGNNNAYCQDNRISWTDWSLLERNRELFEFACAVVRLRREHPVFRSRRWFKGLPVRGSELADIKWFNASGEEMSAEDWETSEARSIAVFLNGDAIPDDDMRGEPVVDDSFVVLINADDNALDFHLPTGRSWTGRWQMVMNTYRAAGPVSRAIEPEQPVWVQSRSMALLQRLP